MEKLIQFDTGLAGVGRINSQKEINRIVNNLKARLGITGIYKGTSIGQGNRLIKRLEKRVARRKSIEKRIAVTTDKKTKANLINYLDENSATSSTGSIAEQVILNVKKEDAREAELNKIKEANKQVVARLKAEISETQKPTRPSNPTPTQRVVTTAVPTKTKATVNTGFVLKDNLPMIIGGLALIGGVIYLKKNGTI